MIGRSFMSEAIYAGRVFQYGKVEQLPFKLPNNELFTIYVRPRGSQDMDVLVKARPIEGKEFVEIPAFTGDWSPLMIQELGETPMLLEDNDVYWGSGGFVYGNNS